MTIPALPRAALGCLALVLGALAPLPPALAAEDRTIRRWVESEFQPSTLPEDQQVAQLAWFAEAARPFAGLSIRIASETTPAHEYQGKILAVAFREITGITVDHALLREDVARAALGSALASGHSEYDGMIVDDDDGAALDSPAILDLDRWVQGEGQAVTDPRLDRPDLIGAGSPRLLPMTRYPLLTWFRQDWFEEPELQARFRAHFGYDLGVPQDWAAYRDIASFFTVDVGRFDDHPVFGHMDGGFMPVRQGWRTARAWLALAGDACLSLPGASLARQGLTSRLDWLALAPPDAAVLTPFQAATMPADGRIAQMFAWDTAFAAEFLAPSRAVQGFDGAPLWRVVPPPHGAGWRAGMPEGALHASGAVLFSSTAAERRKAAWLYEQFLVARTVSLKASHIGLSFIRRSDLSHPSVSDRQWQLGGLIEALRSPAILAMRQEPSSKDDATSAPVWAKAVDDAANRRSGWETGLAGLPGVAGNGALACTPPSPVSKEVGRGHTVDYRALVRSWGSGAAP